MAFLSSVINFIGAVDPPSGLWVWLIRDVFGSFISNYGWTIIVFTLCLRIVLLPLDFFQKKLASDNARKNEAMAPYMEKIKNQYANDRMMMATKQRELQKKFKVSTFGACLPALLSMVIFITMFSGMRKISEYSIYESYEKPKDKYVNAYNIAITVEEAEEAEALFSEMNQRYRLVFDEAVPFELSQTDFVHLISEKQENRAKRALPEEIPDYGLNLSAAIAFAANPENVADGATASVTLSDDSVVTVSRRQEIAYEALLRDMAQDAAQTEYAENHTSNFLWIKSLWQPDAAWTMTGCTFNFTKVTPIPDAKTFKSLLPAGSGCGGCSIDMGDYVKNFSNNEYNMVMYKPANDFSSLNRGVNGYYILLVLAVGFSILSTKINAVGNMAPATTGMDDTANPMGGASMKMMKWMMPIMMGFFALTSNAAFALYMVTSNALSILSTMLCGQLVKLYDKRKDAKAAAAGPSFKRYERTTTADKSDKSEKGNKGAKAVTDGTKAKSAKKTEDAGYAKKETQVGKYSRYEIKPQEKDKKKKK